MLSLLNIITLSAVMVQSKVYLVQSGLIICLAVQEGRQGGMSRYPLGHNSVQRVVHSGEQAGMSVCSTVHAVQCSALDADLRPVQYKQVCLQQQQQH